MHYSVMKIILKLRHWYS